MSVAIHYDFIPMGSVVKPSNGKVYIDVGNAFAPGILDHHHPDAPDACATELVLNHPDYIRSQLTDSTLSIIIHDNPDLDAISGAYFAKMHALGESINENHKQWAHYICKVDQGFTKLNPANPISPCSIFMMRMQHIYHQEPTDINIAMLTGGLEFIETIFTAMGNGNGLHSSDWIEKAFPAEAKAIRIDYDRYLRDIEHAQTLTFDLPLKAGAGRKKVPGIWIKQPESVLFKSWARGDQTYSDCSEGFIFLGIQISTNRFILSVQPDSDVWLKGLGDALELVEQQKREQRGQVRKGKNRPSYQSPDPWYNGNSPLHNYSIIDSPRCGSLLSSSQVKDIVNAFAKKKEAS